MKTVDDQLKELAQEIKKLKGVISSQEVTLKRLVPLVSALETRVNAQTSKIISLQTELSRKR